MKDLTISSKKTIRHAMKFLSKTAEQCLFVIDKNGKLLGTITDGDIRRGILEGINNNELVEKVYFRNPTVIREENFNLSVIKKILVEKELNILPILDEKNKIKKYITWREIFGQKKRKKKLADFAVVIMAGGRGTRLEPFTRVLPKPLVPVKDKPIIEHIIEKFTDVGVKKFFITVNYKSRILKSYFQELQPNYSIKFIDELKPLGTAGGLKFLKDKIKSPILVTNCDIIVNADYNDIYNFHKKNKFDLTLVASAKEYVVPYGICQLNKSGHLLKIQEKPKYNFLANTGLYVVNPKLLSIIPKNKLYHMTDLIKGVRKRKMRIGVYPVNDEEWFDIGQWTEYRKTIEKL